MTRVRVVPDGRSYTVGRAIDADSNVTSPDIFQRCFEHASIGMALTSPETGWLQVNPRLCAMLGYSETALNETTWPALTHPEDL